MRERHAGWMADPAARLDSRCARQLSDQLAEAIPNHAPRFPLQPDSAHPKRCGRLYLFSGTPRQGAAHRAAPCIQRLLGSAKPKAPSSWDASLRTTADIDPVESVNGLSSQALARIWRLHADWRSRST